MRKLLLILTIGLVQVLDSTAAFIPPPGSVIGGGGTGIATNGGSGTNNPFTFIGIVQATTNIPTSLKLTNASFFAYGYSFSNSVASTSQGNEIPGFQPYGGSYYGLTISNSAGMSATNEMACLGFVGGVAAPSNALINFYDLRCISTGSNGDAVSWKTAISVTNDASFYNSLFRACNYAFEQVGRGSFKFFNCRFEALGPSGYDASIGFLPDQGPVTNYLYGCHLVARDSPLSVCFLAQIYSYSIFEGCTFEATSTNATSANVACITTSGEGNYNAVFNNCFFHLAGGLTNYVYDSTAVGAGSAPDSLVFNNCYWDASGTQNRVVVNNSANGTGFIIVNGGNLNPANFSNPEKVSWVASTNAGSLTYSNSWLTATNSRKTNLVRRGTWEADFGFVDVVGGVPLIQVTVEDGTAGITNTWSLQVPGGIASTITNHNSFRIPPGGVVAVTNKSSGTGGDAYIVRSQMTWE